MTNPVSIAIALGCALLLAGCDSGAPEAAPSANETSAASTPTPLPTRESLDTVHVRIETAAGNITLALDAKHAPKTVLNFMQYVDDQRFDGTNFYRASRRNGAPGQGFIQGGIGTDARRMAASVLPLEATNVTGIHHVDGTVSMAHGDDPDSATGNFSILLGPSPSLDARPGEGVRPGSRGFAAFGHVTKGMDVAKRILAQPSGGGAGAMRGQMILKPVPIVRVVRLDGTAHPSGAYKAWLMGQPR